MIFYVSVTVSACLAHLQFAGMHARYNVAYISFGFYIAGINEDDANNESHHSSFAVCVRVGFQ